MANMSYCRFQNTLLDLEDCLYEVHEAVVDDVPFDKFADQLGSDELRAFQELYHRAKQFIKQVDYLTDK